MGKTTRTLPDSSAPLSLQKAAQSNLIPLRPHLLEMIAVLTHRLRRVQNQDQLLILRQSERLLESLARAAATDMLGLTPGEDTPDDIEPEYDRLQCEFSQAWVKGEARGFKRVLH
jgi:hypothetical protein